MAEVVTLAEAKAHANITHDYQDADLDDKLAAATAAVYDWISRRDTAWNAEVLAWTAATIPPGVRHAILVQFNELVRYRGDDPREAPPAQAGTFGPSNTVKALCWRYKDPGVA